MQSSERFLRRKKNELHSNNHNSDHLHHTDGHIYRRKEDKDMRFCKCDRCGAIKKVDDVARVDITDRYGDDLVELCRDCYNEYLARLDDLRLEFTKTKREDEE